MAGHDVFISYSTLDKPTADAVCHGLEAEGVRCWIAPRDVTPGMDWQQSLLDAIAGARAVVLVFTGNANQSANVRKEITAAFESGAVVIPFRLEEVEPQGSLRYHLTGVHWLDALSPPLEQHVKLLAGNIKRMLDRADAAAPQSPAAPPPRTAGPVSGAQSFVAPPPPKALRDPRTAAATPRTGQPPWLLPALGGGLAVVVVALLIWAGSRGGDQPPVVQDGRSGSVSASNTAFGASLSGTQSSGIVGANTAVVPNPSPERLAAVAALRARPESPREVDNELQPIANGTPTSIRGGTLVTTQQLITTLADQSHLSQITLIDALGCGSHDSILTARCVEPTADLPAVLRAANIEPDAPVVFFCHGPDCPNSYVLAQQAIAAGWSNVFWYRGGMRAWQSLNGPTAQPAPLDPAAAQNAPMETTN